MKLLGLVGSHRKNGNSFLILDEVLKDLQVRAEIIQLADSNVQWCDACGLCRETMKCVIQDDVNMIFNKMIDADAVVFSAPRYLPIPSKLMTLIERVGALYHYSSESNSDFKFPLERKPFGLILVSAFGGRQALEALKELAYQVIQCWRMKPITMDTFPYIGAPVRGEEVGAALKDKQGLEQAKELIRKLVK